MNFISYQRVWLHLQSSSFLINLATLEVLTSNIDSTKIQEVLEFLLHTSIIINIGESVDISDAIVLNSALLCIHRLYIGMSYIIRISEHYRNVFRVSLGVFFLLYAHTWWLNMVVEVNLCSFKILLRLVTFVLPLLCPVSAIVKTMRYCTCS